MKVSTVLSYIDLKMFLILDINNLAHFPLNQWHPIVSNGFTHYIMRTNSISYTHTEDKRKQKLASVDDCKQFIKEYIFQHKESRYIIVNDIMNCLIHSYGSNITPYED